MAGIEDSAVRLGARLTRLVQDLGILPDGDAEAVLLPLTAEPVPAEVYDSLLDDCWPEVDPQEASEEARRWVEQFNRLRGWCREIVAIRWLEAVR